MKQGPRLLPLVAFAALCLAGLKLASLLLGGGYVLSGVAPATAQNAAVPAPAAETPAAQAPTAETAGTETQAPAPEAQAPDQARAAAAPNAPAPAPAAPAGEGPQVAPTKTEMDVLESLAERRKALEQHERELFLRENLLKAAQVKVEGRINELKAIEARIERELKKQDAERKAQHDRLVQMYSVMKPKEAAAIFNRMDLEVMTDLVSAMSPRVTSAILAVMDPVVAQRLTMELVSKSQPPTPEAANDLPKIQGRGPS